MPSSSWKPSAIGIALLFSLLGQARADNPSLSSTPISDFRGKTTIIKQRLSGLSPFGRAASQHPSWGIFEITDGRIVRIKQSTLTLNQLFGNAKWWDHAVIASRACAKTEQGWGDSSRCIEGQNDTVTLPDNADFRNYIYEFKWEENGNIVFWKTEITGQNNKN